MKHLAREARDLFLGPVDGDPWEQNVCRIGSALLVLISSAPCLARWVL